MPSKSQAQHNLMQAAAHDAEFAKEHDIDQGTAKEYVEADKKDDSYKEKDKVSNEAINGLLNQYNGVSNEENAGEAIERIRDMAEENDIPEERTDKIIAAELEEQQESKESYVSSLESFLDRNLFLTTEGRPSLEHQLQILSYGQVISQEGMLSAIRDFFTGSKKGEGKLKEKHDPHRGQELMKLIRETYNNQSWLSKQVMRTDPVNAKKIGGYLEQPNWQKTDPVAFMNTINRAATENQNGWFRSVDAFVRHFTPAIKALQKSDYDNDAYHAFVKVVNDSPAVAAFSINPPKNYAPSGRKFTTHSNGRVTVPAPNDVNGTLPAMSKEQVAQVAKLMLANLDIGQNGWKKIADKINSFRTELVNDKLINAYNNGDKRWANIANWADGYSIIFAFQAFSATDYCNDHALFAMARWLDASMK